MLNANFSRLHSVCVLNQKVSDEEDDEGKEPSWEKQEAMVRRLQKKFPDQDKEVKTLCPCL